MFNLRREQYGNSECSQRRKAGRKKGLGKKRKKVSGITLQALTKRGTGTPDKVEKVTKGQMMQTFPVENTPMFRKEV